MLRNVRNKAKDTYDDTYILRTKIMMGGVNSYMQSFGKITTFLGKYLYFWGLGKMNETSG